MENIKLSFMYEHTQTVGVMPTGLVSHQYHIVSHLSFFFPPDELGKTSEASSQRHPVQADVRGAGEQHPAGHHERDVRL